MKTKLTPEELKEKKGIANEILAYCRQQLLNKQPFIGNVAMSLNLKAVRDVRCPTAMTDGSSIYFDMAFLKDLTQQEREFTIAHEVWHCVLLHFLRNGGREQMAWNFATDMEINQLLEKDGFTPPAEVLFPNSKHSKKCTFNLPDDLSAEEYYDLLLKQAKQQMQQQAGQDGQDGSGGPSGKQGQGSRGKRQSSAEKKGISGQFDKHYEPDTDYSEDGSKDTAGTDCWGEKGFDQDFDIGSSRTEAEERQVADHMRESVVSAAQTVERQRGTLPGHIKKLVDKLLKSKMPWKELLAQFITSSFANKTDWNAPNRRFAYSGTYLPRHAGETVRIAVGIDTSGSCSNDCEQFLTEINSIATTFGQYEIHAIQCDTEVKDYKLFDESSPLDPVNNGIEFKGFGGTELHPIFDYIEEHELEVDAVVVFTDGYCEEFNEANTNIELPVLWVLTGNTVEGAENLKVGTKIVLEKD